MDWGKLIVCLDTIERGLDLGASGLEVIDSGLEVVDSGLEVVDSDLEVVDSGLEVVDSDLEVVDSCLEVIDRFGQSLTVWVKYRCQGGLEINRYPNLRSLISVLEVIDCFVMRSVPTCVPNRL